MKIWFVLSDFLIYVENINTQANITPQQLSHIAYHARLPVNKNLLAASLQDYTPMIPHFNLDNVCKPGSTLLWDLVQDDKIVRQLSYDLLIIYTMKAN